MTRHAAIQGHVSLLQNAVTHRTSALTTLAKIVTTLGTGPVIYAVVMVQLPAPALEPAAK